ncbi:MAG: hypothetical protein JO287_05700 [Pseudonocardiales bacterium]|nr:hypothetical protein [Pseudonocardiales bacterium]
MLPALAAATLATAASAAISGSASAAPLDSTVVVHGSTQGLTIQHGQVHAGLVRFLIDTTNDQGSDVVMFSPATGKTVDKVLADLHDELSDDPHTAAQGTKELVDDAQFFGLAGVVKGTPAIITEQLAAGTYYLFDVNPVFAGASPQLTTLQLGGPGRGGGNPRFPFPRLGAGFPFLGHTIKVPAHSITVPLRSSFPLPLPVRSHATVKLTSDDRFDSPDMLPKAGTITVSNVADTIHFMQVSPVQPGTTDDDIQRFFDSHDQGQPPFALDGPSIEMGTLSPGRQADITYNLPAGTYVLQCFIADDQTGMPHALMGMHKVVTLK